MAFVTVLQGVVFIEGDHPRATKMYDATTRVSGFGAPLRNLNDLKATMAARAHGCGCNCVVNFGYGQQTKLIAIDDVAYVGSGIFAILSPQDYNSIMANFV